jgi:hypothetical protein
MKALPQAIAGQNFHIGIMAGKLNGVMPATTPSGWRMRIHVDAGARAVGVLALQQVRRADAELRHFEPALHVALGVGDGLAVLARQRLGQLVHVAVQQLDELHQSCLRNDHVEIILHSPNFKFNQPICSTDVQEP